jgi:hypothetical protein
MPLAEQVASLLSSRPDDATVVDSGHEVRTCPPGGRATPASRKRAGENDGSNNPGVDEHDDVLPDVRSLQPGVPGWRPLG